MAYIVMAWSGTAWALRGAILAIPSPAVPVNPTATARRYLIYAHVCAHVSAHFYAHIHAHVCAHVSAHFYAHIHAHVCAPACTRVHIDIQAITT